MCVFMRYRCNHIYCTCLTVNLNEAIQAEEENENATGAGNGIKDKLIEDTLNYQLV